MPAYFAVSYTPVICGCRNDLGPQKGWICGNMLLVTEIISIHSHISAHFTLMVSNVKLE